MSAKDLLRKARDQAMTEIGGAMETTIAIASDLKLKDSAQKVGLALKHMREDTFRVMLVGRFKNGKSTLLNALLGRPARTIPGLDGRGPMPVDDLPCTATLTAIQYADVPSVKVHKFPGDDGKRRESMIVLCRDLIAKRGEELLADVRQLDAAVSEEVPDTGFARDNTYENTLNKIVTELNGDVLSDLKDLLDDTGDEQGFEVDGPALAARVKKLLPKADLSITIPKSNDIAMGKGAAAGAATGAALGSVVPILGTIFGAALGGVLGGLGGAAAAVESDKQAASAIRSQFRSRLSELAKRYAIVFATIHDEVGTFISDSAQPPKVDPGVVSSHEFADGVRDRLSAALSETQQLLIEYTRIRAFEIHNARNGGPGDEMSDWQQALREVYGRDDESGSEMNAVNAQNGSTMSPPLLAKVSNWLHGSTEVRSAIQNLGGDVNGRSHGLGGNR
jgi:hypothetical protein